MPADLGTYYRLDPYNVPLGANGTPLPGGPWLRTGLSDAENAGRFNINHGTLAVACHAPECPEGKAATFITRATETNREALRQIGFIEPSQTFHFGLHVPFSNGEAPTNAHQRSFLHERGLADQFQNRGRLAERMRAVPITGHPYTIGEGTQQFITPQYLDHRVLDTYNHEGPALSFIDQEGVQYLMPNARGAKEVLVENGFRRDTRMNIPFMNGEKPMVTAKEAQAAENLLHMSPVGRLPSLARLVEHLQAAGAVAGKARW